MKLKRKIIQIDEERCDGCGNCVIGCAEGALAVVDGKAKVISDNLCDGLGACIGECPQDALEIIERDADAFDEAAVEAHLASRKESVQHEEQPGTACGCPSAQIQTFGDTRSSVTINPQPPLGNQASALSHWPVQIRLIPPNAPFLKGADLLVVADCVPVAFPSLHQDLLEGKVVMIGCPKFDDAEAYIEKFTAIFKTSGVKSVTTAVMEVPCCAGLPWMVEKGLAAAKAGIPYNQIVVSTRGEIIEQRRVA
jgi:Pyruvate/2-oxoacid:ferredoxin oxidoreductase delta subunit